MLKKRTFATKSEIINFLKSKNITFERIILIIEHADFHELVYRKV